jgi:hypothetical protein
MIMMPKKIIMGARDIRSIFIPLWQPVKHFRVTTAVTGSIEFKLPLLCIY